MEKFIHVNRDLPALIRAGMIHYQFEAIHSRFHMGLSPKVFVEI
jgi:hypothetical protein